MTLGPDRPADAKARYEIMDALRGIAAVAVVFYHFGSRLGAPATVPHGYLAVDFFFMLSGFVLADAYTRRLSTLATRRFALIRAIRLLPMSVFGLLIGTAYFLVRWKVQPTASDSLPQILGASGLNLALIPKLWIAGATTDEIFPADGVLWSLSFEFMINIVWAAVLVQLKPIVQASVMVIAGLAMAYLVSQSGTANLGWGWHTYSAESPARCSAFPPACCSGASGPWFENRGPYRWSPSRSWSPP